ncbi:unnamed protein product [Nippostrongylus brasiliensis]|uniref:Uncharacterized protein n=1 Tax=Nippostrongylus brasiliensis TaxID=27835 RepID=A0A0N4XRF3_NIPBR|nr:unnamed protein product [Nippostrongylus brasiliensis]
MTICTFNARKLASNASVEDLTMQARNIKDSVIRLTNTNLAMNIDSLEQLATRIGRLRLMRRGSIPALTVFVVYASTSDYDDEEVEELEKLYEEGHTFYNVIVRLSS